jgi:hypothetical protein
VTSPTGTRFAPDLGHLPGLSSNTASSPGNGHTYDRPVSHVTGRPVCRRDTSPTWLPSIPRHSRRRRSLSWRRRRRAARYRGKHVPSWLAQAQQLAAAPASACNRASPAIGLANLPMTFLRSVESRCPTSITYTPVHNAQKMIRSRLTRINTQRRRCEWEPRPDHGPS